MNLPTYQETITTNKQTVIYCYYGGMIRLIFVKNYIYTVLSYHLFGLIVILVHLSMTYLTYLTHIWGYFVAKDKMFSVDSCMN